MAQTTRIFDAAIVEAASRDMNSVHFGARLDRKPGAFANTLGGIYAFDTVANARSFALSYFPTETAKMNAAFYTRLFDASQVEDASRQLNSPFFV